ncbi:MULTISPECIES: hypothetical protein [Candidatus Nitrosocaldus]|uniref:Uncharacterized protein n=1 Tax=Candidatus Nitrosocaldus cavascurensis TaxID=2058097 RepID=A0A2K5ASJ6_9ARCH|nr:MULTISPECIES: hypothetical protein [Candidatus Nitrosocaldus]SPC34611.1 protein of unknown function [Candidatus Nitrosocaldus cavascurensis]
MSRLTSVTLPTLPLTLIEMDEPVLLDLLLDYYAEHTYSAVT